MILSWTKKDPIFKVPRLFATENTGTLSLRDKINLNLCLLIRHWMYNHYFDRYY